MVMVESSVDPDAWNPEPAYRWVWDVVNNKPFRVTSVEALDKAPPEDFPTRRGDRDAEWWGQQASWGLMQVMGAVARERGFDPRVHFPRLCSDPQLGLAYGCAHLAHMRDRWFKEHGWMGVVAAYNAGSVRYRSGVLENADYVRKVARLVDLEALQ